MITAGFGKHRPRAHCCSRLPCARIRLAAAGLAFCRTSGMAAARGPATFGDCRSGFDNFVWVHGIVLGRRQAVQHHPWKSTLRVMRDSRASGQRALNFRDLALRVDPPGGRGGCSSRQGRIVRQGGNGTITPITGPAPIRSVSVGEPCNTTEWTIPHCPLEFYGGVRAD